MPVSVLLGSVFPSDYPLLLLLLLFLLLLLLVLLLLSLLHGWVVE